MRRFILAFFLSYLATLALGLSIAYLNRSVGQVVGTVFVWQELDVPDYRAGDYANGDSTLPFFWAEIGASKRVYERVKKKSDFIPYYGLTTNLEQNRMTEGLFVELYQYDWKFEGEAFTRKIQSVFPMVRDELITDLQSKGVNASPKGEIVTFDNRSRSTLAIMLIANFGFIPSFLITILLVRRRANQITTDNSGELTLPSVSD